MWPSGESIRIVWPSSGLKLASPAVGNAVFIITCLGTFQGIADRLLYVTEITRQAVVRRNASTLVLRHFSPVRRKLSSLKYPAVVQNWVVLRCASYTIPLSNRVIVFCLFWAGDNS